AQGSDEADPLLGATSAELLRLSAGMTPADAGAAPREAAVAAVEPDAARRTEGELLRVSSDRVSSIERTVEALREVRVMLEDRAGDSRHLLATVDAAHRRGQPLDRESVAAVRDLLVDLHRKLGADVGDFGQKLSELDEDLFSLRMQPVKTVLAPLNRAVWEQAQQTGKQVRLELTGAEVALDRRVLQELKDPIVHLVRNAVDHGIETPQARVGAGKSPEGVLRIDVEQRSGTVVVSFADDGGGVDLERVRARGVERGLLSASSAASASEDQLLELLFAPGFSTRAEVSLTSGRGVGLDVVKENVLRMGGRVSISSRLGEGTRIQLELPPTLATSQALLVEIQGHALGLPLSTVARALHRPPSERGADGTPVVEAFGQALEVRPLAELIGLATSSEYAGGSAVVVIRTAGRLLAFSVDRLLGERELVVRPLPPELARIPHLSAATRLGDGRLAFLLQPRALAERTASPRTATPADRKGRRRVLVADDSITTRSLHRQVLEAAGFEVETASDGEEALRLLRTRGAELLVSDIHMPRLDGLTLTRRIRNDPRLGALPVVLVSSLDSALDFANAKDAGASGYLPKGAYQRGELLKLVRGLLP
ncbi:MAG: response regulator, partial [Myxococcota bacterium]|nr:response regulator [Myxococcota bacterium]